MTHTRSVVVPAVATEPIPPGYWQREVSHVPLPLSPLMSSVVFPPVNAGFRRMFTELGVLPETLEWREIRGWVYTRLVPPGGKDRKTPPAVLMPLISRLAPPFRRSAAVAAETIRTDRYGRYVERWFDEWHDELTGRIAALRAVDLTGLSDSALADHVRQVLDVFAHGVDVHFVLQGANAVMLGDLAFTCRDLLGWDDQQTLALLRGLSTASTEPTRRLSQLAELARRRPTVRALVERADPTAAAALAEVDPEFAEEFAAYLHEFGFRAMRYEVIDPTIAETPELVLRLISDQLATEYDPDDDRAREARACALEQARARLSGPDRGRFERVLARAERFYPVREAYGPPTFNEPLALLRHAALEVGRRLVRSGVLASADDAFYLTIDELLGPPSRAAQVVDDRRASREWLLAHPAPVEYGTPPGPPPVLRSLPAEARFVNEAMMWLVDRVFAPDDSARVQPEPTALNGTAASTGCYRGPVRVLRTEAEFDKLQPGDVLVCPITSPTWSVLFAGVGALVTDSGGILSHPAIIAREYGIPAVVAVGNATDVLRDGQMVTVDGATGSVRVES